MNTVFELCKVQVVHSTWYRMRA